MTYARDFMGIPARLRAARGRDPNYREGYRGMRMRGEGWQAGYGEHRSRREADLEPYGGFGGIDGGRPPRGRGRPEDGGVRHPEDPRMLRMFNSNSSGLRDPGDRERLTRDRTPVREWQHRLGSDDRYAGERGSGGFVDYGGPRPR
jgi:hypothetical protein